MQTYIRRHFQLPCIQPSLLLQNIIFTRDEKTFIFVVVVMETNANKFGEEKENEKEGRKQDCWYWANDHKVDVDDEDIDQNWQGHPKLSTSVAQEHTNTLSIEKKQREIELVKAQHVSRGMRRSFWLVNPMGVVQNYLNIRGVSPKIYFQTKPGR